MHDPNLVFSVRLHCMPMRHRKPYTWDAMAPVSRPLASAVLDLMVKVYLASFNPTPSLINEVNPPGSKCIDSKKTMKQNS